MFNQIVYLFLGTTFSVFILMPSHSWAKPIDIDTEVNQTQYLTQNSSLQKASRFRGQRLLEKLNLSTAQQEEIQQIQQTYQPKMGEIRVNLRSEREKLAEMISDNESSSSLRSQHQKIIALDQQVHNLRFESMLEMLAILTPEQRQEFATMMQKNRNFRRGASGQE